MLYFSGLLSVHYFSIKHRSRIVLCIHAGAIPIFFDFISDATQNRQLFSFKLFFLYLPVMFIHFNLCHFYPAAGAANSWVVRYLFTVPLLYPLFIIALLVELQVASKVPYANFYIMTLQLKNYTNAVLSISNHVAFMIVNIECGF
jgi:hypothetical protein